MPDHINTTHNLTKENLQEQSFFEFPCKFPIKIMSNPNKKVITFVLTTLEQLVQNPETIDFKVRKSKTGKYISITATFEATSKKQLDTLYRILNTNSEIYMIL